MSTTLDIDSLGVFQVFTGGGLATIFFRGAMGPSGGCDLVASDLHGGTQIERRVAGIGGNRSQPLAAQQLLIGKPRGLAAEDQGYLPHPCRLEQRGCQLAQCPRGMGEIPATRGETHGQCAIGERALQSEVGVHHRGLEGDRQNGQRIRKRAELRRRDADAGDEGEHHGAEPRTAASRRTTASRGSHR